MLPLTTYAGIDEWYSKANSSPPTRSFANTSTQDNCLTLPRDDHSPTISKSPHQLFATIVNDQTSNVFNHVTIPSPTIIPPRHPPLLPNSPHIITKITETPTVTNPPHAQIETTINPPTDTTIHLQTATPIAHLTHTETTSITNIDNSLQPSQFSSTSNPSQSDSPQSLPNFSPNLFIGFPPLPTNSHRHPMLTRAQLPKNPLRIHELHPSNHANLSICSTPEPIPIPNTIKTAFKSAEWTNAMLDEISALNTNNTWVLVPILDNINVVGSKWVFRVNFKENGNVDRYKAHLVA